MKNVLPVSAASTILQKSEKTNDVLQKWKQNPSCNYEIYKNVGVMHAVVFADGALEAKNAQVTCEKQDVEGLKKRTK